MKRSGHRALIVVSVLVLVASACGSGSEDSSAESPSEVGQSTVSTEADGGSPAAVAVDFDEAAGAVVANSPGTVTTAGPQRLMTAILGPDTRPFLGGPDTPVTISLEATDGDESGQTDGTWLTTNATALGLYVSYFDFPSAGQWEVIVSAEDSEVARTVVTVLDESPVPSLGDPAPATDSPTGSTQEEIAAISTDQDPVAAFYQLSIADAVSNGRPTMIAFVTPAFCQTALCGPTLEAVKGAAAGHDIDVVHVEPFDIELATAGDLRPVPAVTEWGLPTEPWVFVIGADGTVASIFEGIIGQEELEAALDEL